jgi:hypothetical protein
MKMQKKKYEQYLSIALSQDMFKLVKEISDRRKVSMGTVARELLDVGLERIDYSDLLPIEEDQNHEYFQRS